METHYEPFNQNLTFQVGLESVNITVADLNSLVQEGIQSAIVYGSQIGASVVTLLMLLLLTHGEKRRTAMFFFNMSALALDVARVIGSVLFFTSGFFNLYRLVTGDYTTVLLSDYVTSIAAHVFLALEEICINTSLVVQVMAVCSMLRQFHKALVIAVSIVVATVPIGFRFATLVLNSIFTMKDLDFSPYIWLQKVNTITITVAICFFSAIFVAKLGYAIYRRRALGLQGFRPIQAIFITGCQTMIVPAVLSVLQFCTDVPVINTAIVSFVAISLPLSSLWASAAVPGQNAHPDMNASNQQSLWKVLSSIQSTKDSSAAYESMSYSPPPSQLRGYPTMPTFQENGDKVQLLYRGADVENGARTFSASS